MDFPVSPNAIISPQLVRRRVKRANGAEEEKVVDAVNVTTAMLESMTRRKLRERVYNVPFTLVATYADTILQFASLADTQKVKAGMDVFSSVAPAWLRVLAVDTGLLQATVSDALGTGGPASFTFGSEPLYCDGDGSTEILLEEFPILDGNAGIFSVRWRDRDGLKTDFDLLGLFVDIDAGILNTPYDYSRLGFWGIETYRNVEVECRAGYRPPNGASRFSADWWELVEVSIGIAEVLFRDATEILGRATEASMASEGKITIPDVEIPKRLEQKIMRFEREAAGGL